MKCLSDAQIQAVVDDEADDASRQHVTSCARCAGRASERERLTSTFTSSLNAAVEIPPHVSARVNRALTERTSAGATRVRPGSDAAPAAWRTAVWSAGAVMAATAIAIVFIAPLIKEPATVSAAEILARSADRLKQTPAAGVEILEYELTLEGVPREMMPDYEDGAYRVTQIVDHDVQGRYLAAAYGAGNEMLWAVAQDPARRQRTLAVRIDGRPYRFDFQLSAGVTLSPPEMERLHMEACVAMMQASGNQHFDTIDAAAGRQYRIEVPSVTAASTNALWDLSEARALIDANDFHIVELAVRGTFLKQPYSVSYRLLSRALAAPGDVPADRFSIPVDGTAIRLKGDGSSIPVRDALVVALRELRMANEAR